MKNLLVATDLSARSDRAVRRAVSLAHGHGGALTIAHVVDEGTPTSLAELQERVAREIIQDHIDAAPAAMRAKISAEIVRGRPHNDLIDISEKTGAEMIVLGAHREDALKEMFRGTTFERIIRASNVPVLLVKERETDPYRRVVVGIDFSVYSRRAVEFAVAFVPDGAFHLVHAYEVPFGGLLLGDDLRDEVKKEHQARFKRMIDEEMSVFLEGLTTKPPSLDPIVSQGAVQDVIRGQIEKLQPGLLVVGTHGRTGVAKALLGSVAEDLLTDPPCDVLAVKAW